MKIYGTHKTSDIQRSITLYEIYDKLDKEINN